MEKYTSVPVRSSEITPEHIYLNRRRFMKVSAAAGLGAVLAACAPRSAATPTPAGEPDLGAPVTGDKVKSGQKDELGDPLNTYDQITNYNNFYEFSNDKEAVAPLSKDFKTSPWEVKVGGLVNNPKTYSMDEILKKFPAEERIYRLRCVEGWSMVIPWQGFPLAKLLKEVEPTSARQVCGLRDHLRSRADARPENWLFYPGLIPKACAWTKP